MERQTKHRLLGIIVVVALVIILLPFLQSNKELAGETALVTTPPFPDQPANVSSSTEQPVPAPFIEQSQLSKSMDESTINESQLNSPDSIKPSSYRILEENEINAVKKAVLIDQINNEMPKSLLVQQNQPIPDQTTIDEKLLKLKNTVWAVQIGSYKDKVNALRMVNLLRANGYRAFIQESSSANEATTRVFVGPEHKRTNALALVGKLQNEMKLKGMIVSYKPLTL